MLAADLDRGLADHRGGHPGADGATRSQRMLRDRRTVLHAIVVLTATRGLTTPTPPRPCTGGPTTVGCPCGGSPTRSSTSTPPPGTITAPGDRTPGDHRRSAAPREPGPPLPAAAPSDEKEGPRDDDDPVLRPGRRRCVPRRRGRRPPTGGDRRGTVPVRLANGHPAPRPPAGRRLGPTRPRRRRQHLVRRAALTTRLRSCRPADRGRERPSPGARQPRFEPVSGCGSVSSEGPVRCGRRPPGRG